MSQKVRLNVSERATVLAALRFWQRLGLGARVMPIEWDIANNEGTVEPMTSESIDALCERINQGATQHDS